MIKFIIIALLMCWGNIAFSQIHYTVQGSTSKDLEDKKVYLILVEEDNLMNDSTVIVNGKFSFEGESFKSCLATVRIDGLDGIFIVLENGIVRISVDGGKVKCGGTSTNDTFQKYWQEYQVLNQSFLEKYTKLDSLNVSKEEKLELRKKIYTQQREEMKNFVKEVVHDNLDNIIPAFWLRVFQELFTADELKTMLSKASPELKENRFIEKLCSAQEGSSYVDAELEKPDGTKINLSHFVGKGNYVLINVWASWCGACIAEFPEVNRIGEKYKEHGLRILTISIDQDRERWQKALQRLKLSDNQVRAEYSFVNAYGINKIPALMLISPEGTIVRRNFSIDELEGIIKDEKIKTSN